MAGPDHASASRAQLRAGLDCPLDVIVRNIAEDTAYQHEVGRHETVVVVGQRGIAGYDFDLMQSPCCDLLLGEKGVSLIEFHEPGPDIATPRMIGQDL